MPLLAEVDSFLHYPNNEMEHHVDRQTPVRGILGTYPPQPVSPSAPLLPREQRQQLSLPSQRSIQVSPLATTHSFPNLQLHPFRASQVFSYSFFLGVSLVFWILYLLLPRGFRQRYFGAHRKRYARRTNTQIPSTGSWLPASQSMSDTGAPSNATAIHHRNHRINPGVAPSESAVSMGSSLEEARIANTFSSQSQEHSHSVTPSIRQNHHQSSVRGPPSPDHPALKKIPPNSIIAETMARLQGRGIRLVAHGVHSDAKRVWIKLDDDSQCVTWQTEFPRRVPNAAGQVSIVLMRGSVHRIALTNILYIDVGRKTNALKRLDDIKVPDATCFSLLTQNGSLDLQSTSKLERDALVSCFSMILDDVHANENWRELYEASPDPSLANSSVASRSTPAGSSHGLPPTTTTPRVESSAASKTYPNPSDYLVEV